MRTLEINCIALVSFSILILYRLLYALVCWTYLSHAILFIRDTKSKEEYDGIDMENLVTLERLKQNQRSDYLKVNLDSL